MKQQVQVGPHSDTFCWGRIVFIATSFVSWSVSHCLKWVALRKQLVLQVQTIIHKRAYSRPCIPGLAILMNRHHLIGQVLVSGILMFQRLWPTIWHPPSVLFMRFISSHFKVRWLWICHEPILWPVGCCAKLGVNLLDQKCALPVGFLKRAKNCIVYGTKSLSQFLVTLVTGIVVLMTSLCNQWKWSGCTDAFCLQEHEVPCSRTHGNRGFYASFWLGNLERCVQGLQWAQVQPPLTFDSVASYVASPLHSLAVFSRRLVRNVQ